MPGANFINEVRRVGLLGLFNWDDAGNIFFHQALTPEQRAKLDALIAAHDPAAPDYAAELAALDPLLPRCVEDLIAAGAVQESSLPVVMQERLAKKRELRAQLIGG